MGCVGRRAEGCAHDGVSRSGVQWFETQPAHRVPDAAVGTHERPQRSVGVEHVTKASCLRIAPTQTRRTRHPDANATSSPIQTRITVSDCSSGVT